MSVRPPADDSTLYCGAEDVATFFEKVDEFTADSNPTQTEVEKRIRSESNWIDKHTGHAWRERQVEKEYHNFENTYYWRSGMPVKLRKRDIRTPLDESKGDKIEFWTGDGYEEWVSSSSKTEGRNGDYWVNESEGFLYVYRRRIFFRRHKELRITYRYGKERIPQAIQDACARRVAAWFLEAQQYRITTPGNEEAPDAKAVAETWREEAEKMIEPYKEVRSSAI